MTAATLSSAQLAVGFLAARNRRDHAGAETMLAGFETEQERLLAFCIVAEAALSMLAEATGRNFEDVAQEMSTSLAALSIVEA